MQFISDTDVVLLVDLLGIVIKNRHEDRFLCASTPYGTRFLRCEKFENIMVRDITGIRKINYDTRPSMIPRIDRHYALWNGLPFRLLLSNFGLYRS